MEQEFYMTRLYLVDYSTQSVLNLLIILKTVCSRRETMLFCMECFFDGKP